MYGYVYLITNKLDGMKYVGLRASPVFDDNYWGSGVRVINAIKKYGKENFEREILHWCRTPEELLEKELQEHLERGVADSEEYYNIMEGANPILRGEANGFYGKCHTDEVRKKISKANKGRTMSSDEKARRQEFWSTEHGQKNKKLLSKKRKGVKLSEEHRLKIQEALREKADKLSLEKKAFYQTPQGRALREQLRSAAQERFAGVEKSAEHREKISKALTGKTRENPHNRDPEKIRKTAEKHRGMKRSEESRQRMSAAAKQRPPTTKDRFWIHDPRTLEKRMIRQHEEIPNGFRRGYGPRKK
jgi:hypothetical protein